MRGVRSWESGASEDEDETEGAAFVRRKSENNWTMSEMRIRVLNE